MRTEPKLTLEQVNAMENGLPGWDTGGAYWLEPPRVTRLARLRICVSDEKLKKLKKLKKIESLSRRVKNGREKKLKKK